MLVEDAESHLFRSFAGRSGEVDLRRGHVELGAKRAVGLTERHRGDPLGDDPAPLVEHGAKLFVVEAQAVGAQVQRDHAGPRAPHELGGAIGIDRAGRPGLHAELDDRGDPPHARLGALGDPLRREREVVLGPRVDVGEGEDPEIAGMVEVEPEIRPARGEELLPEPERRLEGLLHVALLHVERAVEQGEIEALLAPEVDVDRADRDVGAVGDLLDGRAVEAALEETLLGGVEDRLDGAGLTTLGA